MFLSMTPVLTRAYRIYRPRFLSKRYYNRFEEEAQKMLNELYTVVKAQKFEDIVVIATKFEANPRYLILGNAFNSRHLINGTEQVNKQYKNAIKTEDQEFARLSISKEWNVLDFNSVIVHLFSRETRAHFDIEQLWAVGSEFDDLTNSLQDETALRAQSHPSDLTN